MGKDTAWGHGDAIFEDAVTTPPIPLGVGKEITAA